MNDDLFPLPPAPGVGYVCSSCGSPAKYDPAHAVDDPRRDDPDVHPDRKMVRLLCDACLAIEKLRHG